MFKNLLHKSPEEDLSNLVISEPTGFQQVQHVGVGSDGQVNFDSLPKEWVQTMRAAGIRKRDLRDDTTRNEVFSMLSEQDKKAPQPPPKTRPQPPPPHSSSGFQVPARKPPPPPNKKLPPPPPGKAKPGPPPVPPSRQNPPPPTPSKGNLPPVPPKSYSQPKSNPPPPTPPSRRSGAPPPPPPPINNNEAPATPAPRGMTLAEQLQAKKSDLNQNVVVEEKPKMDEDDIVNSLRGIMIKRRSEMNMEEEVEDDEDDEDDWSD
ncbi:CRIB domain-containing protein [Entamoeba marina]